MKKIFIIKIKGLAILLLLLSACGGGFATTSQASAPQVIAIESFLADIAQNVAGDRLKVAVLIPAGVDPHSFEPTPQDVARLANARLIIINGGGLEEWLGKIITSNTQAEVVEACAGLTSRTPGSGEPGGDHHEHEADPHFWLNPLNVIRYAENIRDALARLDPDGAESYSQNAEAYIAQLRELDSWIEQQVSELPPERRLLVTSHESFGYFADRYGFKIIGTVIPSVSTGASPSAQELAALVDAIRQSRAPAIFLEIGSNPQLARQIATETGVKVISDLYTHSLTPPDGPAPTYLEMMKYNVRTIVAALKGP